MRLKKTISSIAWGDVMLRVLFSGLLLIASYQLLAQSTFAWRIREDVPTGVGGLIFGLSALFALGPLLFGRHYLDAFVVSAFTVTLLGAYWWTTIPWEELITETNFTVEGAPGPMDYLLIVSPAFLAVAYTALSRWSRVRTDLLTRGADSDQVRRAAAASFLGGAVALIAATATGAAFIGLLVLGVLQAAPDFFAGVPGVVGAVIVIGLALALIGRRPRRARVKRPSGREARPEGQERTRARKWPS